MFYSVGDTVILDGIESLIIYDAGSEQSWGRYIVADKNHDLVYYIAGSDYQNESESSSIINSANQYGYEWGGSRTVSGITESIGAGLTNTNILIGRNLLPMFPFWNVLWDKVKEFRETYGEKWFVPSIEESNLIYTNKDSLNGLTTINTINSSDLNPYYWSSSGYDSETSYSIHLHDGSQVQDFKSTHCCRCRLCRYATDSELPSKTTISITCETENSSIYYTLNNTEPTESSTLYTTQFEVNEPCIIKAKAYRNGYLESDISVLDLNTGE